MQELKLENLSIKQKIGMAMTGRITKPLDDPDTQYVLDMIRNHSLGAIWMNPESEHLETWMAAVKEAADYPILIITDAESGLDPYKVGRHNAVGCTGDIKYAYAFGKATGVTARKLGFNVICNPLLDIGVRGCVCGTAVRSLGGNKEKVAEMASAIAHGMHDGGVLTVGKHYPGSCNTTIDSHMAEVSDPTTKEELIEENLYPYRKLIEEGVLDGIMTQHTRLHNIDPDYPASLSKKVIGIIRDLGFNGFAITDALPMMGIVAKFGSTHGKGLSITAGNDLALVWEANQTSYEQLLQCYEEGVFTEEHLDQSVAHVLQAQHKTLSLPTDSKLSEEESKNAELINLKSIYAKTDDGVPVALPRDGKHHFVVLTDMAYTGNPDVVTFKNKWHNPAAIVQRLKEYFPNSDVLTIKEFPSVGEDYTVIHRAVKYDDTVFITFTDSLGYVGRECLTSRVLGVIEALQVTNRVSTVVHFGNPFVLEDMEHIPRVIIGGLSAKSVDYAIDVLAGEEKAEGVLTYDVKLK